MMKNNHRIFRKTEQNTARRVKSMEQLLAFTCSLILWHARSCTWHFHACLACETRHGTGYLAQSLDQHLGGVMIDNCMNSPQLTATCNAHAARDVEK